MTVRTIWIHPFNGIAGDMTLAALLDAGADAEYVTKELATLGVDGWKLFVDSVSRNGIGAVNVTVEANEGHVHRTASDIIELVARAGLPERVTARATSVFEALAKAEGHVHQVDPASVHFHEVGGIDAIIDVVGACLALEQLGIDRIVVAPVTVGRGRVKSAHGIIPNPAPATVRLLENVPTIGLDVPVELTTPTGAALVAALAHEFGPMPQMTIEASGFGAGDAELTDHPNLLQVIVGNGSPTFTEPLVEIETNVDDLSGEYLSHTVGQLLAAGALDAWVTPIEMKKFRPAVTVSALVEPVDVTRLGEVLLAETGSIGFRAHGVERMAVERSIETVEVGGHNIRVKHTPVSSKAEYNDVAAAAKALGRPAREVAADAESRSSSPKFVQ